MAKYIMEEMNFLHRDGQKRLFPRLIGLRSLSHDDLVNHVANHSSFERGIVEGVLMGLVDCIGELMGSEGASVHIDSLGTFTPKLAMKEDREPEESDENPTRRNARSICVGGVNFRPDKEFVRRIDKNCDLQRSPGKETIRPNACPYSAGQRREMLLSYLRETPFINGKKYAELTVMPHTAACKELRALTEGDDALLACQGRGSHRIYTLKQ